jgi:hypothetical protein
MAQGPCVTPHFVHSERAAIRFTAVLYDANEGRLGVALLRRIDEHCLLHVLILSALLGVCSIGLSHVTHAEMIRTLLPSARQPIPQ